MAIDEKTRLDLRREFEQLLGTRLADAAMQAMPNIDYTDLATSTDLTNLRIELRGEIAELRGDLRSEMAELRGELKGDMAKLQVELKGDMADLNVGLRTEMAELRGEFKTDMATQLRTLVLTQLTTMLAMAGMFISFG